MTRAHYWSCSAFAAWLRRIGGLPQLPAAASSAEWKAYRKECQSEAAERRFWETHDSTDHVDWSKAQRDVPYQSLIKVWLQEKLERH